MEVFEKLVLPITVVLLIILGFVFLSNSKTNSATSVVTKDQEISGDTPSKVYETKQGEMGAVTISVTPLTPSKYTLSLNTHSVDLDFDFKEIIKLKDDLNNIYEPTLWTGERGGHHLKGELEFGQVSKKAKSVIFTIKDIEGEVLNLEWVL